MTYTTSSKKDADDFVYLMECRDVYCEVTREGDQWVVKEKE